MTAQLAIGQAILNGLGYRGRHLRLIDSYKKLHAARASLAN